MKGCDSLKFFIYSRKSVYTGKGESTENQIEMCVKYIVSKFISTKEHTIEIYEDEGFSAKDTNRPRFRKMIEDIRNDPPDYIVCYRLDRISRNVSDFSSFIEMLNENNISFICIKEEFDTSRPMGKAMMYIASVFSQLERETTAERVKDNMLMLARTGRWLGGTPPTGYRSEKIHELNGKGKSKTHCRLVAVENELFKIREIYKIFLSSKNIYYVEKTLKLRNITSKNGKLFSAVVIKQILSNPVYCIADTTARSFFEKSNADICFSKENCSSILGIIAYNKRDYTKKNAPVRPIEKWIIAMGEHEGLISGRNWVKVQEILCSPENHRKCKNIHNYPSLLSGLLFCQKCDSIMISKSYISGKGVRRYNYICKQKLKNGASFCTCQNINGAAADFAVVEAIIEFIISGKTSIDIDYSYPFQQIIDDIPYCILHDAIDSSIKKASWKGSELEIYI